MNTSREGKASSVQFIRFPIAAEQVAASKRPGSRILVGIDHPNYGHQAVLPEPAALAEDSD